MHPFDDEPALRPSRARGSTDPHRSGAPSWRGAAGWDPAGVTTQRRWRVDPAQVQWSVPETERVGRPLLVLLHGHGMDEQMGAGLRHQLPAELVLASLRGPLRVGRGFGWFPLDASLRLDQVDEAAQAVLGWARSLTGQSSLGVLGFSQGSSVGLQAIRLAPQVFDYAVVLSGFAVPVAQAGDVELARRRLPVFSGRGDRDPLVPAALVAHTDDWLARHSTLTRRTYGGLGHDVSAAEISDLARFLRDRPAPVEGAAQSKCRESVRSRLISKK